MGFVRGKISGMKVYFNQLPAALEKGLAPIYLIVGDEPLQRMEAADLICAAARKQGIEERRLFAADDGFDWNGLRLASNNLALFSGRQLFDVCLMSNKAGGGDFFKEFVAAPPADVLLMVRAPKIDGRAAWVKKAAETGVVVQVYAKKPGEMKPWLRERMLKAGLKMEDRVIDIIIEHTEGNMLAAAQEVTKLSLLYPRQVISQEAALASVGDSARFSPYDLADAAIAGDVGRATAVLRGLKAENRPVALVLWGLAAQIRKLAALERRIAAGESADALLRGEWRSKRGVLKKALDRRQGARWERLLFWCSEADKAAKGVGEDTEWNELLELTLRIAGVRALPRHLVYRPMGQA